MLEVRVVQGFLQCKEGGKDWSRDIIFKSDSTKHYKAEVNKCRKIVLMYVEIWQVQIHTGKNFTGANKCKVILQVQRNVRLDKCQEI